MMTAEVQAAGPVANREKTACRNGHPFDEANTLWTGRASRPGKLWRECRKCSTLRSRAQRERERKRKEAAVEKPRRTHCSNGHPLVAGNVVTKKNRRGNTEYRCRQCKEQQDQAYADRRRAERNAERAARGLPPTNRGRSASGRQVHWEYEAHLGEDGRGYATATAIEYERANDDSFRLAATRTLRRWMAAEGYGTLARGAWEEWGDRELDWATDLPMTFSVRTIDPLVEVAIAA